MEVKVIILELLFNLVVSLNIHLEDLLEADVDLTFNIKSNHLSNFFSVSTSGQIP